MKRKRLVKTNVGLLQTETGECIIGDKEMAEQLNTYFGSVSTKEDTNEMTEMLENAKFSEREELRVINISREMVLGKLMGLKADKSPEPDNPHPRVLKEVAVEIVGALLIIFQDSIDSGTVPADWRVANVTSIFKKGGREKTGNYRPVSLTLEVGKNSQIHYQGLYSRALRKQWQDQTESAWIYEGEIMLDKSVGIL